MSNPQDSEEDAFASFEIERLRARVEELESELAHMEHAYNTAADRASYEMRRADDLQEDADGWGSPPPPNQQEGEG